jgi:transcriptional regulator with XRE-family HTH domain
MAKSENISSEDIKKFREKEGMTQEDLARLLNVSVTTVSRWETGETKVTGTAAAVLGAILGAAIVAGPVGWLAGGLLGSSYGIYRLLKKRFEPDEGEKGGKGT